jgi:hypothetical protein
VEGFDVARFVAEAKSGESTWDVYVGMTPFVEMAALIKAGVIEPWDEYIPKDLLEDILPSIRDECSVDGKLYSIPFLIDVIVQAWNGYEQDGIWVPVAPDRWEDVWNAGHYLVVIGVDSRNLYFEDPALLGTRGVIPVHEFPDRWHYRRKGTGPGDPDRDYIHPGIRIAGESPAPSSRYTRIT